MKRRFERNRVGRVITIYTRDRQPLSVAVTLLMARDVIDNTYRNDVERGLALALEAALLALDDAEST